MLHCTKEIEMKLQIEDKISEIADKARDRYQDAVNAARKGTQQAAGRVRNGKKPVKTVSRLGIRLSGVSHRTVNKLWKRQTGLVEHQIDALAGHLKAAANADGLKNLVESQIDLLPDNASRFKDEAREAFGIVKGAGTEIRDIVKGTLEELRNSKPASRKTPTARKPAAAKATIVEDEIAA